MLAFRNISSLLLGNVVPASEINRGGEMMGSDACTWGMVGFGLIAILLAVALILGIAALVKYLFFSKGRKSAE